MYDDLRRQYFFHLYSCSVVCCAFRKRSRMKTKHYVCVTGLHGCRPRDLVDRIPVDRPVNRPVNRSTGRPDRSTGRSTGRNVIHLYSPSVAYPVIKNHGIAAGRRFSCPCYGIPRQYEVTEASLVGDAL
jgi:hypothetical protein